MNWESSSTELCEMVVIFTEKHVEEGEQTYCIKFRGKATENFYNKQDFLVDNSVLLLGARVGC